MYRFVKDDNDDREQTNLIRKAHFIAFIGSGEVNIQVRKYFFCVYMKLRWVPTRYTSQ